MIRRLIPLLLLLAVARPQGFFEVSDEVERGYSRVFEVFEVEIVF